MNMSEKKKVKKGAAADAPGGEQGYPASAAMDSGSGMALKEKNMKKNIGGRAPGADAPSGGPPAPAPAPNPNMTGSPGPHTGSMLPGELAKKGMDSDDHGVLCKCGPCGKLESYAKGELKMEKKSPPGRKEEVEKLKAKGMPASEAFGIAWKQHNAETKKSQPNTFVDNSKGKGKLPPEKGGEVVTPKKHAEGGNDGTDTTAGKKLGKAALQTSKPSAMGASPAPAMGAAPKMPKMAGSAIPPPHPAMKPMKLPGVSMKPKMPAMGAGSTAGAGAAPAMKNELAKAGPVSLGARSMAARKKFGERTQAEQAAKLPGVRASVGNTMDQMLATPKPGAMPSSLPATQGAVPGVGHKVARPAQGVQTMAERVASQMPAGPSALKSPPASMAPGPKSLAVVPSLEHLAAKHTPVAAASKGAPALGELAAAHMAAPKLPGTGAPAKKPVQTMTERVASKMPAHASLAVPGEKSHQQLLSEARKAEPKYADPDKNTKTLFEEPEPKVLHPSDKKKPKKPAMTKMEYGLALSELGACALCKKAEHAGPCM